jgi:hypothetical protein
MQLQIIMVVSAMATTPLMQRTESLINGTSADIMFLNLLTFFLQLYRYSFNDGKVDEILESDVCTADAYVLFYNKVVN